MPRLILRENLRTGVRYEVSHFPGGNCLKPIVKLGHIQGDGFLDVTEEQAKEVLAQHKAFVEVSTPSVKETPKVSAPPKQNPAEPREVESPPPARKTAPKAKPSKKR